MQHLSAPHGATTVTARYLQLPYRLVRPLCLFPVPLPIAFSLLWYGLFIVPLCHAMLFEPGIHSLLFGWEVILQFFTGDLCREKKELQQQAAHGRALPSPTPTRSGWHRHLFYPHLHSTGESTAGAEQGSASQLPLQHADWAQKLI